MSHDNPQESNYEHFIEYFNLQKKLNNKQNSALHVCYLIKKVVEQGMMVNFNYHTFVHGEDGDSEDTYQQNRKGAIYFTVNDNSQQIDNKKLYYDRTQLAMVSLGYTSLLSYINKMVLTKYPSELITDKRMHSRTSFSLKMSELKYEKFVDGVLTQRNNNTITKDNFDNFLNIFLTPHLVKEFENIVHYENKPSSNVVKLKM